VEGGVIVRRYEPQADYSATIEETFKKFQQGNVKDYRITLPDYPDMNHIEAQILDFVALLFTAIFTRLDAYYSKNAAYLDSAIAAFDREIQFYLAYPGAGGGAQACWAQFLLSRRLGCEQGRL